MAEILCAGVNKGAWKLYWVLLWCERCYWACDFL